MKETMYENDNEKITTKNINNHERKDKKIINQKVSTRKKVFGLSKINNHERHESTRKKNILF